MFFAKKAFFFLCIFFSKKNANFTREKGTRINFDVIFFVFARAGEQKSIF